MPKRLSASGCHAPIAETVSVPAEIIKPIFRPKDFATNPARAPPIMHPIRALDTTNPLTESAYFFDNIQVMLNIILIKYFIYNVIRTYRININTIINSHSGSH